MQHPEHVQFLSPSTMPSIPGYSQIATVRGGQTIYISGQVALDLEGNLVGAGDFRAQAQQVFENLKAALAEAGADFSHVVKLGLYLTDISQLPILREVRNQYVNTKTPPASTAVEVSRLFREGILVEVEAIASLPGE